MSRGRWKREHELPSFPFHCYTHPITGQGSARLDASARVGAIPHRCKGGRLIVTFGEAGDTAQFRMYIDEL
jgi:hypothetical protein